MKRILFLLILGLSGTLAAIEGQVLATLARNLEDQWKELLPEREPIVSTISMVTRGQPFQIRIVFRLPALAEDRKADVTASLRITAPDGKLFRSEEEQVLLRGPLPADGHALLLAPHPLVLCFERGDPNGEYGIEVLLKDHVSGRTASLRTGVQLVDRLPSGPPVFWQTMRKLYYAEPHPERILPAFQEMLPFLEEKKRERNWNPTSLTASFYFLLRNNPQLLDEFYRLSDTLPHNQKLEAAGIINSLGADAVRRARQLSGSEMHSLLNLRAVNLFRMEKITRPIHLDLLWSEFFADGTAAPLKKIVGALDLLRFNMTPEQFRKLKQPTPQDREKLIRTLIGRAALWSLSANAREHDLVFWYLEGFFFRRRTGSDFSRIAVGVLLKQILSEREEGNAAGIGEEPEKKPEV